jgi:hypothetical protein
MNRVLFVLFVAMCVLGLILKAWDMMNSRNAKKPRRAPVKEPRRGASEALFDCRFGQETWTERVCAGDQKRGRGERGLSEG